MPGPTLIIGGAQKAGTTALFFSLGQHPDVFTPAVKEPSFFSEPGRDAGPGAAVMERGVIRDRGQYERLFEDGAGHQHRLEGSTAYLGEADAAAAIHSFDPLIRMIFVLRDPADRAFSAYSYLRQRGLEPCQSFEGALASEQERIARGWPHSYGYLRMSRYGDRLAPFLAQFPAEQILLLSYQRLLEEPAATLREVEQFASLDPFGGYELGARYNPSGQPRSRLAQRLLDLSAPNLRGRLRQRLPAAVHRRLVAARDWNVREGPALDADQRRALIAELAPQIDVIRKIAGPEMVAGWEQT